MKFLYIGQYSEGTTSKMRADTIAEILYDWQFEVIDTHVPFFKTGHLMRSVGFRFQFGCLIKNINKYILNRLGSEYDFIWVDKAIFIKEETTKILKEKTSKLIHYTPDAAFIINKSKHFESSISIYDYLITTKSFELKYYQDRIDKSIIIYTTQGFDIKIHRSIIPFDEKKDAVLFIGRYEKNREHFIKLLLDAKINVSISGNNWIKFVEKNKKNKNFRWLGKGLYNEEYSKAISSHKISWGALSKLMPEKHTTRTFEIPACGTALITEHNEETSSFFNDDEVIFYTSEKEFVEKIKLYLGNYEELKSISEKAYNKVVSEGYDYKSIIKKILKQAGII